jgi:hypothetical protein
MAFIETAKPATAETVNGLQIGEQLCGRLNNHDTRSLREIQAFRLNRRFGFAFETAAVIASLAWGSAR